MPDVKVHDVKALPDGRLVVTGAVDGVACRGSGWTEWLTGYWDDNSKKDKAGQPKPRKATKEEARAYCEQLLLESAGQHADTTPPVKIKLDARED